MKHINYKNFIIYEDSNYIALNKPPMIATLPERVGNNTNILELLKADFKDIKICHRLDKGTSGVVVFAKNKEAQRHISLLFYRRQIDKEYHAVSSGQHSFRNFAAKGAINIKSGQSYIDAKKGKKSKTLFFTEKIYKHFTLLLCKPITGRTHQIRLHASSKKAHIVGDKKYYGKDVFLSQIKNTYKTKKNEEELPIIKRVALHAKKITFLGLNNEDISIEAPYSCDFKLLLKYLDKYDSIL